MLTFGVSVGECAMVVLLGLLVALWNWYWMYNYGYITTTVGKRADNHYSDEMAARGLGHVCNVLSALLILPVTRTGLWVDVFGVAFDRAVRVHRVLGAAAYVVLTLHMFAWWWTWAAMGLLGTNIAAVSTLMINRAKSRPTNWSIPLAELSWLLLSLSLVFAVLYRRKFYPVFLATHKYVGILYYVAAIWHSWAFW